MRNLVPILGLMVITYLLVSISRMFLLAQTAGKLIEQHQPHNQQPADSTKRALFIGDSTGAGIGASSPKLSVAGRLGQEFPQLAIDNRSLSGLKSHQLLERVDKSQRYDLIVINIGANDVIRGTDLSQMSQELNSILEWASINAKQVIWYTSGKIGEAPFFASYLKPILNQRSLKLRSIAIRLASAYPNVKYIDLVKDGKDLFSSDPHKYYSADGLHPSDAGYELWYTEMKKVLDPDKIM